MGENIRVSKFMLSHPMRGPGRRSCITGRSVHNQRITVALKVARCDGVQCGGNDLQSNSNNVQCNGNDVQCDGNDVQCDDNDMQCDDNDVRCDSLRWSHYVRITIDATVTMCN